MNRNASVEWKMWHFFRIADLQFFFLERIWYHSFILVAARKSHLLLVNLKNSNWIWISLFIWTQKKSNCGSSAALRYEIKEWNTVFNWKLAASSCVPLRLHFLLSFMIIEIRHSSPHPKWKHTLSSIECISILQYWQLQRKLWYRTIANISYCGTFCPCKCVVLSAFA